MYILFGNSVIDSKEIKDIIEANSNFKVVKDMSKGSKREDILAYNLSIKLDILKESLEEDNDIAEDDLFDEYLTLAEESATELYKIVPEDAILDIRAYKWDKSDNDIKLIAAIAHKETGEAKLENVMKVLIRQAE